MRPARFVARVVLTACVVLTGALRTFAADDPLSQAKMLYADASFEEALATLDRLTGAAATTPDVLTYRALCLLALGRAPEAQAVTEAMVKSAPTYVPSASDLSPRFLALVRDSRQKLLPGVARERFAEARQQYQAKDTAKAEAGFQTVLALTDDPVWKGSSDAADLRVLASGFVDLVKASAAAAAPKAPVAAPAPPPPPPTTVFVPAVVVRQTLPRWVAPDMASRNREYRGEVKVTVGADGRVRTAVLQTPTHPVYDQQVLVAAKEWQYRPATRNGQPVESDRVVVYYLRAGTAAP